MVAFPFINPSVADSDILVKTILQDKVTMRKLRAGKAPACNNPGRVQTMNKNSAFEYLKSPHVEQEIYQTYLKSQETKLRLMHG